MMMDATTSSGKNKKHPSVLVRIAILGCLLMGPIAWRHRVEIRAHWQGGPKRNNRKSNKEGLPRPATNSNMLDIDESTITVQVSHHNPGIVDDAWTPSPVKNVNYTGQSMVPVLEQHEQRRELRELLVTESRAWRIGNEPEFVSVLEFAMICL